MNRALDAAYEAYRDRRDETALAEVLAGEPMIIPTGVEYPTIHRIEDIRIRGKDFRVNRIATEEGEELLIVPCDTPSLESKGVPYELTGWRLLAWIADEIRQEADEDVDFNPYGEPGWDAYLTRAEQAIPPNDR